MDLDQFQLHKRKKMMYIMEHVAENGFDTSKFNKYYSDKYSTYKQAFLNYCRSPWSIDASLNVDTLSLEQV